MALAWSTGETGRRYRYLHAGYTCEPSVFPQPSSQAKGIGFPLARLVGVICLSTGAVLEAAIGPHAGKGRSELDLFRSLLATLSCEDVPLVDALYCNYFPQPCKPRALTCCSSNTARASPIFAAANPSASGFIRCIGAFPSAQSG